MAADHLLPSMNVDIGEVLEGTMTEMQAQPQGRSEGQVLPVIEGGRRQEVRDITETATEPETDFMNGDRVETDPEIDIPVEVRGVTGRIDTGTTEIANLVSEMVPKHQHLEIHLGIILEHS